MNDSIHAELDTKIKKPGSMEYSAAIASTNIRILEIYHGYVLYWRQSPMKTADFLKWT